MKHTLHHHHRHTLWDNSLETTMEIKTGETVKLDMIEDSDGKISLNSTVKDVENLGPARVNPIS